MTDPLNPRLNDQELLELIQQRCPHLTRAEILAIAASAGFDLVDLAEPVPDPGSVLNLATTVANPKYRGT